MLDNNKTVPMSIDFWTNRYVLFYTNNNNNNNNDLKWSGNYSITFVNFSIIISRIC